MFRLQFDPPFLPLQTLAIALIAAGIAFTLYIRWELRARARRSLGLLVLRGAVVLLLAFILLNPTITASVPKTTGKPPFLIVLDTSRSMTMPDAEGGETRWAAAKRLGLENRTLLDALRRRYDVRVYGFDARAVARPPEALLQLANPDGGSTNIADAITQAVNANVPSREARNISSGGLLLLSDGRDNGGGYPLEAARDAHALGFPVYTVCVGQETHARDLEVVAKRPQVFSAPGQTIEMTAEIRDKGIEQATVRVDLLKEGKRIASRNVRVAPGRRDVSFPVSEARKGFYRYAFACSTVPGEASEMNNRASVFLNVMETRARVLLLEGHPSWDSKFLAQTLRDDPTILLDSIYKLTADKPFVLSGSPNRPTLSIPRTVADFLHYDVIILGKGYEEFFDAPATEALKTWVSDRGGNLVFLRGRADERTDALRALEPVTFTDQQIEAAPLRLTEAGRSHPGFAFDTREDAQTVVQKLPSLISATRIQGEKALAVVLARAPGVDDTTDAANTQEMAVLAYQRYGQGKTLAIVGQGLWRWAFLPPELEAYGRVYEEFWTQTIRWMISESDFLPGQNIALHTDRTSYSNKETVNFLGYRRGAHPAAMPVITVTRPDGRTEKLVSAPGDGKSADFTAVYRPLLPGEYLATVPPLPGSENATPASASFTVYPGQEEDANRSADPALMQQIAQAGGGQALTVRDIAALPEKLRAAEQSARRIQEPQTAWDRGWILALLVALLTVEWLLRRRFGLS